MELQPQPLTQEAFAPFGDVIETEGARSFLINDGMCERFDDLAAVDVLEAGGRPLISIFRCKPWPLPLTVRLLERHPLSSQAFIPLSADPFLVVVAPPGEAVAPEQVRAFVTNGRQGVNYHRGVWHHPLVAMGKEADFLIVDRGAQDEDCDFVHFEGSTQPVVAAAAPEYSVRSGNPNVLPDRG